MIKPSEENTINSIIKLAKILESKRHHALLQYSISAQLYALLSTIERLEKNNQDTHITAVAKELGLKVTSISRLAERAENQGILNRKLTHNKLKPITLTKKGLEIFKQAQKELSSLHKEISNQFLLKEESARITFSKTLDF